jgi:uncharacterized protein (DUF1501 family)
VPRLGHALPILDTGVAALKDALGTAWMDTVVLVTTEFGRTVRVNGSGGTDHGTATVAFLLGHKVAGGRVQADWPGLAEANLFENRDLQPTLDLRAAIKGVLKSLFALPEKELESVIPGRQLAPFDGLLRT